MHIESSETKQRIAVQVFVNHINKTFDETSTIYSNMTRLQHHTESLYEEGLQLALAKIKSKSTEAPIYPGLTVQIVKRYLSSSRFKMKEAVFDFFAALRNIYVTLANHQRYAIRLFKSIELTKCHK